MFSQVFTLSVGDNHNTRNKFKVHPKFYQLLHLPLSFSIRDHDFITDQKYPIY